VIVRPKKKKAPVTERKVGYIFIVKRCGTDEVVGEFKSFPAIPGRYCDEEKYRIIFREER
jgi:hypothetical protein